MLSDKSIPYIDASVAVLKEHGVTITTHFYASMFEEYPHLKNLFNMGNQANGSQQQSLASAVFAYAANHSNADALTPVLTRIAHKHASVGLTSSHYPIVGRHLLGAIANTLGEAATPELMAAWDEAYWLIAGELISAESRLYERSGSFAGQRNKMRVVERYMQTEEIMSLTLENDSSSQLADFVPGQYVTVGVQLSPGVFQQRQYSLSDAPNGVTWKISVRREHGIGSNPEGAVSNWLHDNVKTGDILEVSQPFGDFAPVLKGSEPIVLLSAGVGITPMISVLNALASQLSTRKIVFAHAARNTENLAHLRDLEIAQSYLPQLDLHFWVESGELPSLETSSLEHGRMSAGDLIDKQPCLNDAIYYICGPLPFMQAQRASLINKGIHPEKIHREVFGPELLEYLM